MKCTRYASVATPWLAKETPGPASRSSRSCESAVKSTSSPLSLVPPLPPLPLSPRPKLEPHPLALSSSQKSLKLGRFLWGSWTRTCALGRLAGFFFPTYSSLKRLPTAFRALYATMMSEECPITCTSVLSRLAGHFPARRTNTSMEPDWTNWLNTITYRCSSVNPSDALMHPSAPRICSSICPSNRSVGAGSPDTALITSTDSRNPSCASIESLLITALTCCSNASMCCRTDARLSRSLDERFFALACLILAASSSFSRLIRFFRMLDSRLLSFLRLSDAVGWWG